MKCANSNCNRGIGLIADTHDIEDIVVRDDRACTDVTSQR